MCAVAIILCSFVALVVALPPYDPRGYLGAAGFGLTLLAIWLLASYGWL